MQFTEATPITFRGQTMSVASACYATGVPVKLAVSRLNRGAFRNDIEACVSTPALTPDQIAEAAAKRADWEARQARRAAQAQQASVAAPRAAPVVVPQEAPSRASGARGRDHRHTDAKRLERGGREWKRPDRRRTPYGFIDDSRYDQE